MDGGLFVDSRYASSLLAFVGMADLDENRDAK
jgi:hypothetical protein